MVDSDRLADWPVEEIPGHHKLYMRVHRNNVVGRELTPVALRDHAPPEGGRPGMSTEWCRYSTPEATRSRYGRPENYGVVAMLVEEVRSIPGVSVEHSPLPDNRAHSDVFGDKKDQEIRVRLTRACQWVIDPPVQP